MYQCDGCGDVVHGDDTFTFQDSLLEKMLRGFHHRKLRDYLIENMNIEEEKLKNKLETLHKCDHIFCDNCLDIDKAWLKIEEYKDTDEYFNFYKLTLKSLMEFSCKQCEEKQNIERTCNDFNHFKRETKHLLEKLKNKPYKSFVEKHIDEFIKNYYK